MQERRKKERESKKEELFIKVFAVSEWCVMNQI
jgi:hypothetical protein